ncbi:gliding motility-associated C-terminal domain-containing protein [Flavobacterium maritimum]|uniref:gliding motility-associated C-terminal domain-containing protein n=1 Tax=Flavobacterium maritimum TaxID=3149042 RepID=UPI0032B46B9B
MKNKLLLFLLFHLLIGHKLTARSFGSLVFIPKMNSELFAKKNDPKPTKKDKVNYTAIKPVAVLAPPTVVAGSICGPGIVNLSATGASGETIEWFADQTTSTVLFTGSNYSPNVTTTTTFYVSSRSGSDLSIRVPVVASVYSVPPSITLSASPVNNTTTPLCLGTSVTFTASGGADLFEFSVDGVVKQAMSTSKTFTTNALTNGQTVSVRSRYAVILDGTITETAWGTGPMENNTLSASLSVNAIGGYINSVKISPTEDKLVFGIAGKLINYRRVLLFLDTKSGGFNVSNYGDENGSLPPVRAFNYFNNNPSTFDSYFAADYCIAIATDGGETNYYADVIELKTGNSIKTYLGTAATGAPTAVMGINKNNTGITDYTKGFEVEVLKSLIGYTGGDIKFFAFTMQDNAESNYNVTNSFLSPELSSSSDYGSGAVNYNLKDPNPVIVAATALSPCYSEDNITMNFVSNPTTATVGANQSKCLLTSDALGGNTPIVGTGLWTKKSGPGTASFSDASNGNSTASVSAVGTYVFTWTISSGQCATSSADVTVLYNVTEPPTGSSNQNFCKINTPKVSNLVAAGTNVEWFTALTGGVSIPANTDLNTGTYYAEQTNLSTSCKSISRLRVDVIVDNPIGPIVDATQTFCNTAKVSDLVATGTAVKWYDAPNGGSPKDPNTLLVNGETYYATQTVSGTLSCESTPRIPTEVTINVTPMPSGSGAQTVCNAGTIADLVATGTGTIKWYLNAAGGSPLPSSQILVTGTTYYASQTILSCESDSRYPLLVTINDPQAPISGGNQSVCATNPLQTLTASATVATGTVVWYDALTNGNLVTNPISNTVGSKTYYAQNNIGSCSSVSRTAVTLEIKDSPFLNVITKVCSLDLLTYSVDFTAVSGSTITLNPVVGNIVGNSITGIPAGTNFTITADKGNGCIEVYNVIAPNCSCSLIDNPISGGDQTVCEGQSNPTLSATVNSGETVDWYGDNSGGVPLATNSTTYIPTNTLPGVFTYYAEARKTVDACLSSGRTAVSLTITAQAKPTGASTQSFCESENATVASLVATGTGIKWYANATGGSSLSVTEALVDSEDYYATQTATSGLLCESVDRLKVIVSITKPAAPITTDAVQTFCNSATSADLQVTGTNVKWYDVLNNLISDVTPLSDGDYFATQTISGCESVNRLKVTVIINKPSIPAIVNALTFCEGDNATVASLTSQVTSGADIKWYASSTGKTPLNPSDILIDNIYYGTQTVSGCESESRVAVNVTINKPAKPSGDGIQEFCSSENATISNLIVTGGLPFLWYDASNGGNLLINTSILENGKKYYVSQTVAGCESVERLEVTAVVVDPPTPTIVNPNVFFCESESATLNSIVLQGIVNNSNIAWYTAASNGSLLPGNTPLVSGSKYYAAQKSTTPIVGCESINRLEVTVTIDAIQPPVIDVITQPTCAKNTGSVLLTGLPATGLWTINSSDGTSVSNTGNTYLFDNLAPSASYTFKVTNDKGCTSVLSSSMVVINSVPAAPVVPTVSGVIQPTCGIPSGSITIATQSGMEYSLDGITYQSSNLFPGLVPNNYTLYVRNLLDDTCVTTSASAISINAIPSAPITPTASSVIQPTCGTPAGSITITVQSGMEYSLDGITYQSSNLFLGLVPNNYTLYVRNLLDDTCVTASASVITISAIPSAPVAPTTASVIQPTCGTPAGSITIAVQSGMEYSLDGITYQSSNLFPGLVPSNYMLYVRNLLDATCVTTSASAITINAIPMAPVVPTAASVVQPICETPSGTIVIAAQAGVEYSIDNVSFQASEIFLGLSPNSYTLYVRNLADHSCLSQSNSAVIIDPLPVLPATPTLAEITQPTCLEPTGKIEITPQVNVQYSIGNGYQDSNLFVDLLPGKYTISVRLTNSITCISSGLEQTINPIPPQIQFETTGDCENKVYKLTASPLASSYNPDNVSYLWKDANGSPVGSNSNVLNLSEVISSSSEKETFPVTYTLTITSTDTGCETSGDTTVESIYCDIQKGISPDGNGSNDYFDLRLMDVKKLEIFNRYGINVYSQSNYSDQWKGQSSGGDDLPSATYYYVIEFNSGQSKTGWIYLIREK